MSWTAYHAKFMGKPKLGPSIGALLPLFQEQAKSAAMLKHSLNIIKSAVESLNPGQIPVVAFDQPLFAVAKQIQWTWPETHGEEKFIVTFGGLHIEMAAWKLIGSWLEDSGWAACLVQAQIASQGTADSFHKASHVGRTRHAHQVNASSLAILLHQAYEQQYLVHQANDEGEPLLEEEWQKQQCEASPLFKYWHQILQLELLILVFIRSIRTADFPLYIEAITQLLPWFFALDHIHYARWLSVHVRDMTTLPVKHPTVAAHFEGGHFVIHKTVKHYSAIAIDHAHEQNNAIVKGDGGAVGLTENPAALRRWMVAGPEMASLVIQFEDNADMHTVSDDERHHEEMPSVQKRFSDEVKALVTSYEEMGNPFIHSGTDLYALDTKIVSKAYKSVPL